MTRYYCLQGRLFKHDNDAESWPTGWTAVFDAAEVEALIHAAIKQCEFVQRQSGQGDVHGKYAVIVLRRLLTALEGEGQ